MSALLEVTGVTKRYPGVVANDNVSLTVNAGDSENFTFMKY